LEAPGRSIEAFGMISEGDGKCANRREPPCALRMGRKSHSAL
jgi:hypothetical protein